MLLNACDLLSKGNFRSSTDAKHNQFLIAHMEKTAVWRKGIANIIVALPTHDKTAVVTCLWEPIKGQVVRMVGEEGFRFLFDRCIFITTGTFTWLGGADTSSVSTPLSDLSNLLEQQEAPQAREASTALLLNFIELVESLIGELLTIDILRSALGSDVLGSMNEKAQS